MYYELFLLRPNDYQVVNYNALNKFFDLKVTKAYNQIGSFSFGVRYSLDEFEAAINTGFGQAQVQLFLNGRPYIHGIIKSYSPDEYGFVKVDCVEVLQDLIDDVAVGDYILKNIDYEYIPPRNGMTPTQNIVSLQAPYWDISGLSYWYTYGNGYGTTITPRPDEIPTATQGTIRGYSYQTDAHLFVNGMDKGVADGSAKAVEASSSVTIQFKCIGFNDTITNTLVVRAGSVSQVTSNMSTGTMAFGAPPSDLPSNSGDVLHYGLVEDSTGIYASEARGVRIFNKQLHYNHQPNYVMKVKSNGIAALYGSFISDTKDINPVGIHSIINFIYATQSLTINSVSSPKGPSGKAGFYANFSDGRTYQNLVETVLPTFVDENGVYVTGIYAAQNGTIEVEYHYVSSQLYINAWCVYKITFNKVTQTATSSVAGYNVSDFNFPDFTQPAVQDKTKVTEQGSVLLGGGSNGKITGIDIDKGVKNNLLQWLQASSPRISFIKGDASIAMDKVLRKLTYKDADRWQIVKDILELAGPVTLHYRGITNSQPTYEIYDYTQLPIVPKFVNGNEIFNINFIEDFADVYNVLVARASFNLNTDQYNLTNNLEVTIAPNPDRPNRLGRLKRKVVNSSSIKDIGTLSTWAYSLYDEHAKPSEPINFSVFIDDFWGSIKLGQRITVHGIKQSQGITEQLNKITVDTTTGMITVELAKRINFQSAFLEATLKATNY